jgi:hypothetical protein
MLEGRTLGGVRSGLAGATERATDKERAEKSLNYKASLAVE